MWFNRLFLDLCLVYFVIMNADDASGYGHTSRSTGTLSELKRLKRQTQTSNYCSDEQWQCRSGACVSVDSICDGVVDCPDGSDETHALCRKMRCPSNLFRCTYGACVRGTAACDGRVDCADASDEISPICRDDEVNDDYTCGSGERIPAYLRCDGIADCVDGSDETVRSCGSMTCLPHLFQCAYGACADRGAECDGKLDCADGSDESEELCGGTAVQLVKFTSANTGTEIKPIIREVIIPATMCMLPAYPEHGEYMVIGVPAASPGQVLVNPVLEVSCHVGYSLDASSNLHCIDGLWSAPFPRCVKQCVMPSNPTVQYECQVTINSTKITRPCDEYELEGTSAKPICKENYRMKDFPHTAKCVDGRWEKLITCSPECGTVLAKPQQLMVGGRDAKRGELTWHAGIYTKKRDIEQICGGSLIRRSTIVSAAQCFFDASKGGKMPARNYYVAVGKISRSWYDNKTKDTQRRDVSEIHIPESYSDYETNFHDDIALVEVAQPFEYTAYIRPVCLDFGLEFDREQLQPGNLGKVAGWGLEDPSGRPSEVLKAVELPVVEFQVCWDNAPLEFKPHITSNKFCAGYYNGTALCMGDNGGGLSFPAKESGEIRYYLRGVVSTAPASEEDENCNAMTVTTFTRITVQKPFFMEYLREEY